MGKMSLLLPLLALWACQAQARTEVMFWFDTENYTEEFAAEPIKDIANLLAEEGVRGHFCFVGYEAKKIVDWRRTDIMDALKPHVIGSQTLYHTWHPNITEATDIEDFDAAYRHAASEEYLSNGMIMAATGREKLMCSVLPGNGNTIVALYLYADMGIPFFGGGCGVYADSGKRGEVWYCNQRHRPYYKDLHLESFLPPKPQPDLDRKLDEMATYGAVTLYMHPHMAVVTCHPDGLNWDKRNMTEFGKWVPCPHRDPEDTKLYYARLRAFVRRLKADPRFEITDCEKLLARQRPRTAIARSDVPAIRAALGKDFGPISSPASWCVADCFLAAVAFLRGEQTHLPGKVYGFLYAPRGVTEPVAVTRADLVAAARAMDVSRFLPPSIRVGGATIGPADFLFAALETIETGAETVTVRPREQLGDIAAKLPVMADFKCAGTWRYMPSFKDEWISNRLRWQFWTLRYEPQGPEEPARLPDLGKVRVAEAGHPLVYSVYDAALRRVAEADRACDAKWLALKTPAEVAAHQRQVRERAVAALGGFPARTPLNARTVGVIPRGAYRVEKVIFESRPRFHVTGHLYVPAPDRFKGPFPAIAVPCGHSFDGKSAPTYSNAGAVGAEKGFVVLVYDPVCQGERGQQRDGRSTWSPTAEHNNLGLRAFLLGESAAQVRIFDGIRAVDYLRSRTDVVDPGRVGVAGMSGGGTLSAYVNAFAEEVACAAPSGFLSTVRDVYDNCGPQDAEQVIFGQLAHGLNHLGIVCLRAPSPILISTSESDFFPQMGADVLLANARSVYGVMGAAGKVAQVSVPGPHSWYRSQKEVMFSWMSEWLGGRKGAYEADHLSVRRRFLGYECRGDRAGIAEEPPPVRNVTPTGRVLDLPGELSIYDVYRDKLAAFGRRGRPTRAKVREVTGIRELAELSAAAIPAEDGVVLSRADGTMIPVVYARPASPSGLPPALVVSDAPSRKFLADAMKAALAEGRAVAIADLRGFGETGRSRHDANGKRPGDEEIARCLMALGDSLVARRAEDLMLAAREVAKALGAPPLLRAEGRAVIPAAHARFLEPQLFAGAETAREPPSWAALVADETRTGGFADLVRGALCVYDWTDLMDAE